MTKSEAKAIQQRCLDVLCILEMPHAAGVVTIPYDKMDKETSDTTYKAIKGACDRVREVLQMVEAELGGR